MAEKEKYKLFASLQQFSFLKKRKKKKRPHYWLYLHKFGILILKSSASAALFIFSNYHVYRPSADICNWGPHSSDVTLCVVLAAEDGQAQRWADGRRARDAVSPHSCDSLELFHGNASIPNTHCCFLVPPSPQTNPVDTSTPFTT